MSRREQLEVAQLRREVSELRKMVLSVVEDCREAVELAEQTAVELQEIAADFRAFLEAKRG